MRVRDLQCRFRVEVCFYRGEATELNDVDRKATMGRKLMTPRTDRTTRIPSGVASPVTTNHAATGSMFVNLSNTGNFKKWPI